MKARVNRKRLFGWGVAAILYGVFMFIRHPILIKLLISSDTRIAGLPSACTVHINQQKLRGARCFRLVAEFNWEEKHWNRPTEDILLWLPQQSEYRGRTILVANPEQNEAGRPSNTDYLSIDLIWNKVLVQSKGISGFLSFTNRLKFCGKDPAFQQQEQQTSFTVPVGYSASWLQDKTLEVNLQP